MILGALFFNPGFMINISFNDVYFGCILGSYITFVKHSYIISCIVQIKRFIPGVSLSLNKKNYNLFPFVATSVSYT